MQFDWAVDEIWVKTEGDAFLALSWSRSTEENDPTVPKDEFYKKLKIPRDSPKTSLQDNINFIFASQRILES